MKWIKRVLLLSIMGITGCANQPHLYVYGKYLDGHQKQKIKYIVENAGYAQVHFNEFDFPTKINENTLLYSLFLNDPDAVATLSDLVSQAGFAIENYHEWAYGNHWYTNDSMALFLFPDSKDESVFFTQDLINRYQGEDCGEITDLILNPEGTFRLIDAVANDENRNGSVTGRWQYRQYPYVELQSEGAPYADYYFKIMQFTNADQVSEVEFLQLVLIDAAALPEKCVFVVGKRLTQ